MISKQSLEDAQLLWEYHQMRHDPQPCSVAIGLGSHDLGVADATANLYKSGIVPLIVFTGATSTTTVHRMPRGEAVHYKERALELGIPASAILLEPKARNTGENVSFSRQLLASLGIEVESITLVSKPYEERRAYATARRIWPEVQVYSASTSMTFDEYVESLGDPRLVIDMLVGALQRILVYPARGYMVSQPVPGEVLLAYERLCKAGFTSRLLGDVV